MIRSIIPGRSKTDINIRPTRKWLRWIAWNLVTILLSVILGMLYITFVGITVDASFLRSRIAQTFTDNIGRSVRFEGAMEMEISATPKLRVGGLHIGNAAGFGGGDLASLGEARLAVDLWPLLFRKQLHIDELAGSDVHARLQVRPDGSNNWTFNLAGSRTRPTPRSERTPAVSADQAFALLDIQRITLERLNVEYVGANSRSHYFALHSLAAESPANAPLKVLLDGAVEKEFPYKLDFTGGKLADLATDEPWPIAFTLTFLSSTLAVTGNVSGSSGEVTIGLGTENLLELEQLLQINLPDVGASGIAAVVGFSPQRVSVKQLTGGFGNTTLIGDLEFDRAGLKPQLTGSLIAPTLDLRPYYVDSPANENEAQSPRNFAEVYRRLAAASFELGKLNDADLDITLGVERWLSLPGDVKDVRLQIKLRDGILQAPLTASMAGVTMSGQAFADASAEPPRFSLALGTSDSDLGDLAELLTGLRGVRGHLGRFDLDLAAQGNRGSELAQSLDVQLRIDRGRFSYGNVAGGRPVNFALEQMAIHLPPGKALGGNMRGALLGQPFSAKLTSGALEPIMLQGRAPLDFVLRSGDVKARIHGSIEAPQEDRGPDLEFEFSAPRAGEIASWFGFEPASQAPAAISGKASLREFAWQVNDFQLAMGRSKLSAELSRNSFDGTPLLKARLDGSQIDIAQLESMIPKSSKPKTTRDRPILDIPMLPQQIDLSDADISVRIRQFAGTTVKVGDVSFEGRIRDGYMHPSPFSINASDTEFGGAVLLDLRGAVPMAGLWLYAEDLDVGKLLRTLGAARDIEANFSEFGVNLIARSSRLGDMLKHSELLGVVGGGRIVLRDQNTRGEARITLDTGELRADPGMPVRMAINGALDEVPISVTVETAPANDLVNPRLPLKFALRAEAANTHVDLTGSIARPIGHELELALNARGNRFDDLDNLTRASLPPWGPWSAVGKFRMSPQGYEINALQLRIGESVLSGAGRLDTVTGKPRINVALNAPTIQLDDFKLANWSPVEKKPEKESKTVDAEEVRRKAAQASDTTQKLLSPEMLSRQDVYLSVEVNQVLSGKDKLGEGKMEARLERGRADIGPIEIEVPGGKAKLQLGYQPTDQDVQVDLQIEVEQFDYGVLARRIRPGTDLNGTFSVSMDVDSRARFLSDILRHGNGRIDFAIWPKNLKSGIFDLWAVNVLVALVPAVDPDKASKVNCAIGRFDLADGKLVDKTIVLDTTRMRVTGKGKADFADENFDLEMRPQAKTAQFLSLATPIQVSGPFNDFKIGVSPGDILGTIARLATSILWVPLQKLAGKKIPPDGADVCNVTLQDLSAR